MLILETRLLPLMILGLGAYAHWAPYPQAWPWIVVAAIALAVLVLLRAVPERKQVFAPPLSYNVATLYKLAIFTVTRLIVPAAVIYLGLAWLIGSASMDDAVVTAIILAIIAML